MKQEIFNEIEFELKSANVFDKLAKFKCFSDNIFTYHIVDNSTIHEINIIADDTFFSNEKISDLFNKNRIGYFEHSIFIKNGENHEKIGSKSYRPLSDIEPN